MFSEKSDCMVDNIHLEKLKVCWIFKISLYKAKFPFNHNGLRLPTVHAWNIPQVGHSHKTVMSKYSNAKFNFPFDKSFNFALRISLLLLLEFPYLLIVYFWRRQLYFKSMKKKKVITSSDGTTAWKNMKHGLTFDSSITFEIFVFNLSAYSLTTLSYMTGL